MADDVDLARIVADQLAAIGDARSLLDRIAPLWVEMAEDALDIATWDGELDRWWHEILQLYGQFARNEITTHQLAEALDEAQARTGGSQAIVDVRALATVLRLE